MDTHMNGGRRAGGFVFVVAMGIAGFASACGGGEHSSPAAPSGTTASTSYAPMASSLKALSPSFQVVAAAGAVQNAPTVIVLDQDAAPIKGVTVSFDVTSGGGSVSKPLATSDAAGAATSGQWVVGSAPGENALLARVVGDGSVTALQFSALAIIVGPDSSTFDLTMMGTQSLPVTYSGGGSSWTFTGGRFALAAGGTYTHYYVMTTKDANGVLSVDSAQGFFRDFYTRFGSTITFAANGQSYATGTLNGSVLNVRYFDALDNDDEVYVVRPPAASARVAPCVRTMSAGSPGRC
jgi:hypothetical protein